MCKACTEAVHCVSLWTRGTLGLGMWKACTEAVQCVALWTRVTLGLGMCKVCTEAVPGVLAYVPKQSIAYLSTLWCPKVATVPGHEGTWHQKEVHRDCLFLFLQKSCVCSSWPKPNPTKNEQQMQRIFQICLTRLEKFKGFKTPACTKKTVKNSLHPSGSADRNMFLVPTYSQVSTKFHPILLGVQYRITKKNKNNRFTLTKKEHSAWISYVCLKRNVPFWSFFVGAHGSQTFGLYPPQTLRGRKVGPF